MKSNITIEIEENVPVGASLKNGKIVISLDDYFNPVTLIVSREVAEKLREQLQEANEEKTNEMYEEELISKETRIEELEDTIAQYEENLDAYKEKLIMSTGPL
ncbi:Uncharacterised protein [Clostridium paraputrificum]|uniref:hypothetical protein n=1 Tax=Clostridium paraputrificum TaxID=29363 RepID=UPI0006C629F7|nr:hypothetical protein [Clostridium paraputrificum]CUQ09596.1 Uncharacterised protein [Clostridium paraputrificum]